MLPLVLFGVVIYFGVRSVLDRDGDDSGAPQIVPIPIPGVPPVPTSPPLPGTPGDLKAPDGWPSTVDFATCEDFMSKNIPQDQLVEMLKKLAVMSDEEWAQSKAKMVSLGAKQLAECLDGARQVYKKLPKTA